MSDFKKELTNLINRHSKENDSDYILADYLKHCLEAFDKATNTRDRWLMIKLKRSMS